MNPTINNVRFSVDDINIGNLENTTNCNGKK